MAKGQTSTAYDFDGLKAALEKMKNVGYDSKNFNYFHILKLASNESVHSTFISWILAPDSVLNKNNESLIKFFDLFFKCESPKCGEYVNNKKVRSNEEIIGLGKNEFIDKISKCKTYEVKTEYVMINKENRMDIFMDFGDTVVVIENKIDTKPHDDQLCRYIQEVEESEYGKYKNKIFVYLSPRVSDGELPTNIGGDEEYNENYCVLDYESIYNWVNWCIKGPAKNNGNKETIRFLKNYNEMLEVEIIMKSNDTRTICKEIRKKYARELDLIMGYTDNIRSVLNYAKEWVEQKGMHIFPPKNTKVEQVSFDFYSDTIEKVYKYQDDKKGNKTKKNAGYYHCGTDGGNVLCIWHLIDGEDARKKIPQEYPNSYKLETLLTWEERAKEFNTDDNCDCSDESILCKKTVDIKLENCWKKISKFEKDLQKHNGI